MYPDSRQTIHMGINYVFVPMPVVNSLSHLRFQEALRGNGIDFRTTSVDEQGILVVRETPSQLEIKVAAMGQPPFGQLLVIAPHPGCDVEIFVRDVEAVVRAFESTWSAQNRQIVHSDAAVRDLFETTAQHAFQELWEMRLGQPAELLGVLGRPVLGGGLRFVMPPEQGSPESAQIEVKIESFLRDTHKIFVETQFAWPGPQPQGEEFDPAGKLRRVDSYVEREVISFLTGEAR